VTIRNRLRRWRRRTRRRRAAKRQQAPLREFVYLDDVSVYSLLASRLGPIATEFTETETSSLQGELSSSFGTGIAVAKGEVSSRAQSSRAQGSQVLRKSIVQTAFKELYELEEGSLLMRPLAPDAKPPSLNSAAELLRGAESSQFEDWIVDPDLLARGQMLEAEVELEAEAVFRVSAVLSSILEIVQENADILREESGDLAQAMAANRMIEKLLAGLIPIRALVVDFVVLEVGDKPLLVRRELLTQLAETERPAVGSVYLVGVAQESLFWKDIRRILFSNSRFRVLCRLAQQGLQNSWTPVKLVDVLSVVMPDLAGQVDIAVRGALAAMSNATAGTDGRAEQSSSAMRTALIEYGTALATHSGNSLSEEDLVQRGMPSPDHCASFATIKGRREAFAAMTGFVEERFGIERDPIVEAHYRSAALLDAGLGLEGQLIDFAEPSQALQQQASNEWFLDAEFVAMYW
jgi:hypothetical protein